VRTNLDGCAVLSAVSFNVVDVLGYARELHAKLGARVLPWLDQASARVDWDLPLLEAGLRKLEPTLSLQRIRARVSAVHAETADVTTFWLQPNARFAGHRPGTYVTIQVSIAGREHARAYSVSSAPRSDGLISITVKRVPGGVVSNWLADHLSVGDVLTLSAARGEFVLPAALPAKLVMLSAGSGITPVMSMLRALAAQRQCPEIVFLHCARSPRDLIFGAELEQLARTLPGLRLCFCVEQADASWNGAVGRFSTALLRDLEPDFDRLPSFLCGPTGFMQAVMESYEHASGLSQLRYERFNADFDATAFLNDVQVIRFVRSGAQRICDRPRTILEEAECAGVSIPSGCRAGNCGTCRSLKKRGVVVDISTGRASGAGEEPFFPCVSVARGTVEVDL
jgi:ferredoxin-NADP reductase